MTYDLALAFAAYAFVTSITPGPNNTMLLASGVNHGFFRSIPHLFGVNLGFSVLFLTVGLGFGALLAAVPSLHTALAVVGAVYLVRLAWKIARSGPAEGGAAAQPPLGFLQAAAFQWVNPKAWVMATGAATTYLPAPVRAVDLAALAAGYALVNAPCIAAWTGFGVALRRILAAPRTARIFNRAMAVLLVLSLAPLLRDALS